jgi:Uma2 family endonuclease
MILHTRPALEVSDVQFFEFCRQNRDTRIEQTREGDWIIMAPTGFETGSRNSEVNRQLGNWARQDKTGIAADSSTGFGLPNGAKRSPDAAWVTRERLAGLTPEQKQRFLPLCPDFALELCSPSDSLADTQEKMAEYRENGARLGWLLDAAERQVYVYRPQAEVSVLDTPATLSGEPELPGFTLDLALIWNPGF